MKFIDLTGKQFDRLTVLYQDLSITKHVAWVCSCLCGKTKSIQSYSLRHGKTKSCGCLHKEIVSDIGKKYHASFVRHGHRTRKQSRTYSIWCSMRTRATNKNTKFAKNYVLRGIGICDEWKNDFCSFLNDTGEAPLGYQIDRIDNNLGYYKENCRWVTPKENCNNKRNNLSQKSA